MAKPQTARQIINTFITQERLPDGFAELALEFFLPLADSVAERYAAVTQATACHALVSQAANTAQSCAPTLVVGINGAQGTGKSTVSALLRLLLQARGLTCVVISIDDLYLTRDERARLAHEIHPLLSTRGVPGTHDLALGLSLLTELKAASSGSQILIPRFDKARDDRCPRGEWVSHSGPVHVIVLEGWCVGALPASLSGTPINRLEQEHDADGAWRAYIEARLLEYQRLFRQIDMLVMLKAPSMQSIIEWRSLQEQKLLAKAGAAASDGIMNQDQLLWFIMHYERLTHDMLETLPAHADVVFYLDSSHDIVKACYRDPGDQNKGDQNKGAVATQEAHD